MTRMPRLAAVLSVTATLSLGLAACSATHETTSPTGGEHGTVSQHADQVLVHDAWLKASEGHMTAGFGIISNPTSEDITVVSADSSVSGHTELHETVEAADGTMSMQEVQGGFVIPAGGELVLQPGGNHLMLMQLSEPILAGSTVTFTLTLGDGTQVQFDAPAKDFSGANESYVQH